MQQKILLIDDDDAISTVFEDSLKHGGYDVTRAATGQDGITQAKAIHPDFVLLDQVLPDISGNEVLKTLKVDQATKDIPVAILSNFGQEELIKEALTLGAVNYILKYQIEADDLPNKVKELLREAHPSTGVTPPETGTV